MPGTEKVISRCQPFIIITTTTITVIYHLHFYSRINFKDVIYLLFSGLLLHQRSTCVWLCHLTHLLDYNIGNMHDLDGHSNHNNI